MFPIPGLKRNRQEEYESRASWSYLVSRTLAMLGVGAGYRGVGGGYCRMDKKLKIEAQCHTVSVQFGHPHLLPPPPIS